MSRDDLAKVIHAHQTLDYDRIVGSYDCECGHEVARHTSAPTAYQRFARHQADMVIAHIRTEQAA